MPFFRADSNQAAEIFATPTGSLSSISVEGQLDELEAEKSNVPISEYLVGVINGVNNTFTTTMSATKIINVYLNGVEGEAFAFVPPNIIQVVDPPFVGDTLRTLYIPI